MTQQWRVRIHGNQREDFDPDLLIQAVIALGRQLRKESQTLTSGTGTEKADEQQGADS